MTARSEIVQAAREWVGTPFRHQGRLQGQGVDCIGLVAGVARSLALLPAAQIDAIEARHSGYGREPAKGMLERALDDVLVRVARADMQSGDVLLMRFVREPQHVAILDLEGEVPYIVHAYQGVQRCVHHRLDEAWARRIVRAYCFPEVG